jgi:hypothetical protein
MSDKFYFTPDKLATKLLEKIMPSKKAGATLFKLLLSNRPCRAPHKKGRTAAAHPAG